MFSQSSRFLVNQTTRAPILSVHQFRHKISSSAKALPHTSSQAQSLEPDQRQRLSKIWAPSGGIVAPADEDAHSKLVRAGFIRQAHSGIFHMLPLGLRVLNKVERLIEKHMSRLSASKLELSSISSEELWSKSGRLAGINSELFRFKDRKEAGYLLSPTHEEEITTLVANTVKSYKELPARLYQISRKYRDELRPRHGLLRSREFVMKDLYTFDINSCLALATYHEVRDVYADLFDELKISYLVAEADSGNMGGNLSHEFHFPTPKGEDHVISCQKCDYVANEELAEAAISTNSEANDAAVWSFSNSDERTVPSPPLYTVWRGISRDRKTLVNVWHSLADGANNHEINTHAVKAVVPELDAGVENATSAWTQSIVTAQPEGALAEMCIVNLIDNSLPVSILDELNSSYADPSNALVGSFSPKVTAKILVKNPATGKRLNLLRIRDGDQCPRCEDGLLKVQKAIELGHTFFLGTRYSEPLEAFVTLPAGFSVPESAFADKNMQDASPSQNFLSSDIQVPMQMGCHGIGVSRMIGAVAETLADEKGLNWPRVIAPYEIVVIPTKTAELETGTVYDALTKGQQVGGLDVIIDDTPHSFAWKMNDADLIGYPVIVVLGKRWKKDQICEVQCRRLGIKEDVSFQNLHAFVASLLSQL